MRVGRWRSVALNIWGSWTSDALNGTRLHLSIVDTNAADHTPLRGYDSLIDEASRRFGEPEIVDRNPLSPHALWCRNDLTVSVDAYTRELRQPLIQLTIESVRAFISPPAVPAPEFMLGA